MGGWIGGQAEYVMVPYADFNLLKFLTKSKPWKDIRSNYAVIFFQPVSRAVMAGVKPGSVVYIAGAGPVGLACASSCQLLGAAIV
jgi:glutathione-independent formaldehyde dehydrogenase